MILPVTLTSAGAAALINAWLAARCGRTRMSEKVLMGDDGNPRMVARMRAHANFAEYTPIVLILIGLIELAMGTSTWLWAVAALYLVARILHPLGMDGTLAKGRMIGIVVTMLVTIGLGLYAAALPFLMTGKISAISPGAEIETVPLG